MPNQLGSLGAGGGAAANPLASVPWVAQWKFNNNGNDSIGSNHLTNNNSATFTTGLLGGATGATQLTAVSTQYWSKASNAVLQAGDIDFTWLAWVYLDSKTAEGTIVNKGAASFEYLLYYPAATNRFRFIVNGTTASSTNFGAASLATWYCVIGWYDSSANTLNISVNDIAETPVALASGGSVGTDEFQIGVYGTPGAGRYWDGAIDNVCFAKSATGAGGVLSAAQRTAFYKGGVGTEAITAIMEYQRQQRQVWGEIGKEWERFKRGWFQQGRGRRVFA